MVVSLEKEKSLMIQEKELALAAHKKSEEEKAKLAKECQQATERADKVETQNLELQAKLQRLEAELQVPTTFRLTKGFLSRIFIGIVFFAEINIMFFLGC